MRILGWTALLATAGFAFGGQPVLAEELTIFWAEWDPANYLQELANQYTAETGVNVKVETTTWPDFQTKAFIELNAHGDSYDLVVGDSQWLGAGATQGHYVELTDFVEQHNLTKIMTPASMTYYSEYPKDSGRYWAVPLESDAIGWAYRKDWFEKPLEMRAFKENYGYDLAAPKTWKQLRDIAEFFYRPNANPPRYGIGIYTQANADGLAMGFTTALYSYGGELGNYATCAVDGIVNSPRAIQALEAYKELYSFTAPGWANARTTERPASPKIVRRQVQLGIRQEEVKHLGRPNIRSQRVAADLVSEGDSQRVKSIVHEFRQFSHLERRRKDGRINASVKV
jgi:multiple sugar transport system substrate-binding protein